MGVYKKAVITDAGRAMMARSISGETVMQFSRAVTSSYVYPPETDFKGYLSLEGIRQTVIPSNVQVVNDTLISVRSMFGNESISESYLIQNIGLYATDGNEEILFSVSQATAPDEMPAYNGVAPSSFIYTIQAAVSQASSLSLTINPAGTATALDIQDLDGAKLDKQGDISETAIETLETTEDKFPIPAVGEKVKTFLGKIITFLRNIKPLSGAIDIYVATTGSDTEGTGTQENPFKTIQRAVNSVPKDLGGTKVAIIVADGTYDEDVYIYGVSNGNFTIKTTLESGINDNCRVKSIQIKHCSSAYMIVSGFTLYNVVDASIICWCTYYVRIEYCKTTVSAPTKQGIYLGETSGVVVQCLVSNKGTALQVVHGKVHSSTWDSGSINDRGLMVSTGGIISKIGVQPIGTLYQEVSNSGGMIFNENGTQISGIITSGLSCTWGTISLGGYVRHGNSKGAAMITVQLRIITATALTAGTEYVISGFPIPVAETGVAVSLSASTANCYLSASNGQIRFTPNVNRGVGTFTTFNCTYLTVD